VRPFTRADNCCVLYALCGYEACLFPNAIAFGYCRTTDNRPGVCTSYGAGMRTITWQWVTGETPFNFAFFGSGEPNNGASQYAGMDNRYNWKYNDYGDYASGYVAGYIAEHHSAEADSTMADDCDAAGFFLGLRHRESSRR
jgi:hypothetical protein